MNLIVLFALLALVVAVVLFVRRKPALPAPRSDREPAAPTTPVASPLPSRAVTESKPAAAPSPPPVQPPAATAPTRRTRDVAALRKGLAKMRDATGIFGRLQGLFGGGRTIAPGLVEAIEEVLITSDVGARTTEQLLASIRAGLAKKELADPDRVWDALRTRANEMLDLPGGGALRTDAHPTVVLMVGVNGAGKTTTIGKLATRLSEQGRKVLLVAGDTFRAAAVQQLQEWGRRTRCEVFAGKEGADPASVIFDAVSHAIAGQHDIVLCDTAGRLHTKSNLMDELRKVHRTTQKVLPGAPHEVLLVVDGTTGQNALQQATEFGEALPLSGIVLTKLDGTAKGGVVLAIANERRLPVRYIGVGERAEDMRDFEAGEFVEALLGTADEGDGRAA